MHFKIRRDDKHTYTYTHLNFPSMHLNGSIHIQMRPNIRLSFPVCIYCCICITRANIYIKTCTNGRYHPVKVWLTMNCIHVFWGNFGWYLNLLLRMDIYIYIHPPAKHFCARYLKLAVCKYVHILYIYIHIQCMCLNMHICTAMGSCSMCTVVWFGGGN